MVKVFYRELQTNDGKVDESDPDGDLLRIFFRSLSGVAGSIFKFQPDEMEPILETQPADSWDFRILAVLRF